VRLSLLEPEIPVLVDRIIPGRFRDPDNYMIVIVFFHPPFKVRSRGIEQNKASYTFSTVITVKIFIPYADKVVGAFKVLHQFFTVGKQKTSGLIAGI
jgi:hypothetical protein